MISQTAQNEYMVGLFSFIFLFSLILLPLGLLKPSILSFFHIPDPTRKKALSIFGSSLLISFILIGITAPSTKKDNSQVSGIAITKVPTEVFYPSPTVESSITPIPLNLEFIKVKRVTDGDTITLENGKVVRYIGIDAPESVDPRKPIQCYAKEASIKNKELVEGQVVGLEKDISETDKYGRLLRYVYKDSVLVNELLVKEGYAHSSSYPPDIKYQDRFKLAEQEAIENKRGLWGEICIITPTTQITLPDTIIPTKSKTFVIQDQKSQPQTEKVIQPKTPASGDYTCNCSKTCPNMSCTEAQYQLNVCGCSARDADKDGIACDSQCQ